MDGVAIVFFRFKGVAIVVVDGKMQYHINI
jgi:hypothetical protein